MNLLDAIRFALGTLRAYRLRAGLMLLAMAIGVASVVVLTSLGEAARRYVTGEFSALGTHMIIVLPGRSETAGLGPSMFTAETPRDLTLADAAALTRSNTVVRVAPINVGAAPVSWGGRERDVVILGTTADFLDIRHFKMNQGRFLPPGDPETANAVCVLGTKVRDELFGATPALGKWIRIGDRRFRVIGILASEGQSIGVNTEDLVVIPVASAQSLLNTSSVFRILVEARSRELIPAAKRHIVATIKARHQGEEDVTVITQDAVLATFDKILQALTFAVAGIASISLVVAGILIMNVMLVAVTQRTSEIGLLKALGATAQQILRLFLVEAALLSLIGAVVGVSVGQAGSWFIGRIYPTLPVGAPWWAFTAAVGVALGTGLLFGILPAKRAARLDPVRALQRR
jgi:putative ABC transport system permease protein